MGDQPTMDEWKYAYSLAAEIKAIAPWRWMYDLDNFGFEHPKSREKSFVCVMGHEEEHFGITVYRGAKSFFNVLHASQSVGGDETAILEIEGVSLSFEDRKFVKPEDRNQIKKLGLSFRGRNAWPLFRSNRPVHLPWFVDATELDLLGIALERLIEVAPLWKDKQKYAELDVAAQDNRFLMCIPSEQNGRICWKNEIQQIHPPLEPNIAPLIEEADIQEVLDLPRVANKIELSMSIMRNPIQEHKDERPYFSYLMLLVEAGDGFVAGVELFPPKPQYEDAYRQLGSFLVKSLLKNQILPDEIFVKNELHAAWVKPITDQLGIKITVKPTLPRSEDAMTSFMNFRNF